jgi:hypothetical protein
MTGCRELPNDRPMATETHGIVTEPVGVFRVIPRLLIRVRGQIYAIRD